MADASSVEDMEGLVKHTRERLGEIDILVYNSGTNVKDRALTRLTPATWDKMISVNMNGAFYATQAALPGMRQRGSGHLIYVASISGMVPDVSGASYQASKRGLLGMAHAVRVEEKENGIRTCVVCPGLVDTEISGEPSGEAIGGDAGEGTAAGGRGGSYFGCGETAGARGGAGIAGDADVFVRRSRGRGGRPTFDIPANFRVAAAY